MVQGASSQAARTGTVRVAGIDLGTNTCLCLIADCEVNEAGVNLKVVRDEVRVVRLGQGVNATRSLHPEALARAEEVFKEFRRFLDEAKCEHVLAVATSAARDVTNGHLLIELGRKYGIPIEIISGEKEAELTFAGSIEPSWKGLTAVIDVGGGSTEIILGDENGIRARASADVGAVRLTEAYVTEHPIPHDQFNKMISRVREALQETKHKISKAMSETGTSFDDINQIVGVAGTPTTLAAVDLGHAYESEIVHGHLFTRAKLEEWALKLSKMKVTERQMLAGMEPKRADVIVAGTICVTEAMRAIGGDTLKVSIRGLRYGVAQWCARSVTTFLAIVFFVSVVSLFEVDRAFAEIGTPPSASSRPVFKKRKIKIGTKTINVEVADTDERRAYGLMFREKLGPDEGMLFEFEDERTRAFWMQNTLIPLSIGYFSRAKILGEIINMYPPPLVQARPKTYPSRTKAMFALEMNQGWYERNKIRPGVPFRFADN